jgi:polysaccharide deacetylase family protein (PEP-CTERM system associated)
VTTESEGIRATPYEVRIEPIPLHRPAADGPLHAFTVDVEDWYQSCVDFDAPITERVVRNVDRTLDVLDDRGVKATFFVQGKVAEAFPRLVETLVTEGHEVQSHGYSHRPLFAFDREGLRAELERGRGTVEDAAGTRVTAFRAADFSIMRENLWALDVLSEVGFEVDSSIFPARTRRYGIAGWELAPHVLRLATGAELLEVPVAMWARGRWRLPVAGGGYFRVLPAALLDRALAAIAHSGRPAVVYSHPYEFNATELAEYRGTVPARFLRAQGLGRKSFVPRLRRLLTRQRFGRLDAVLRAWGATSTSRT